MPGQRMLWPALVLARLVDLLASQPSQLVTQPARGATAARMTEGDAPTL